MPEAPQMQALAERIGAWLEGATFEGYAPLGFTGLKTYDPPPEALIGQTLERVDRRAKYVSCGSTTTCASCSTSRRPAASTSRNRRRRRNRRAQSCGGTSPDDRAVLVREHGTERKAGWWVLGPGRRRSPRGARTGSDERRVRAVAPRRPTDGRRIHTILRDQRTVAGVGRGYADDVLHRAKLSPYASLKSLTPKKRERLIAALHEVLDEGLERERTRTGGLSREQARRALHRARQGGRARARCAAPTSSASRTSHTKSCTARIVRPAARSSPTVGCRGSSSESARSAHISQITSCASSPPPVSWSAPASVSRTASPGWSDSDPARSAVPVATKSERTARRAR